MFYLTITGNFEGLNTFLEIRFWKYEKLFQKSEAQFFGWKY